MNRLHRTCFFAALAALLTFAIPVVAATKERAKVVIVAGKKSHGYGAHEFNAGSLLIQRMLKASAPGVEVVVYKNGWPQAEDAFEGADAIVLFMDGGGGHPGNQHLDQWYFNMRFREKMEGVTSVLKAVPDNETRSGKTSWPRGARKDIVDASGREESLLWATERKDGGRGVGFTGAHFHWNFGDDGFRKLVLNAIVWVAGMEVPEKGIETAKPTQAELEANQDFPKPEGKDKKNK